MHPPFKTSLMSQAFSFLLAVSAVVALSVSAQAQGSKKQITANMETWLASHADGYTIDISDKEGTALVTRYHPERPEEKNDLIEVNYKGMTITLKFKKPLAEITTHKDSLQKYYDYVGLSRIYHDIETPGWNTHVQTPSSPMRGKGVIFTQGGEHISFTLNWQLSYAMAYRDTEKCNEELQIEDGSVSEDCFSHVSRKIPLVIEVKAVAVAK